MFRYERPQAGRLREFHQLGVECFGSKILQQMLKPLLWPTNSLIRLALRMLPFI